jgi:hypothetical protein
MGVESKSTGYLTQIISTHLSSKHVLDCDYVE